MMNIVLKKSVSHLFWFILIVCGVLFSGCGLGAPVLPSGEVPQPTAHDRFIKVKGVNLHYTEYPGKGENIVLLHGFASSTYTWEEVAALLNQAGHHVWALDLKGFGWSDKPLDARYDPISLMKDVNAWMNALKLRQTVFVGNSMGGAIAVLLSRTYPERVKKMVLIDAGGYPMWTPLAIKLLKLPLAEYFYKLFFGPWALRWNLGEVFYDKQKVTDTKIQAYYQRACTQNALAVLCKTARAIDFSDPNPIIVAAKGNPTPTLIIWGREDQWIPLKVGRRFKQEMLHADLQVIDNCGHMPQEEKPQVTAQMILAFIEKGGTADGIQKQDRGR